MKMVSSGRFAVFVGLCSLALFAVGDAQAQTIDQVAEGVPLGNRPAVVQLNEGGLAVGYYDGSRALKVVSGSKTLYDSTDEFVAGALSGLALMSEGKDLWWAFRPKEPQREVAVRSSNGARLSVDGVSLPLPRIALLPGDKGGVEVFWTGERPIANPDKESAIGFAQFDANGKPVVIADTLPGEIPAVVVTESGTRVLVTNHGHDEGGKVSAWVAPKGATPFVVEVASGVAAVQPTGAAVHGERVFAYWNNESGRLDGESLLQIAYSDDGKVWTPVSLEWNKRAFPNELRFAGDDAGNMLLTVSVAMLQEDEKRFARVLLYRSSDNGVTWVQAPSLREGEYEYAKQDSAGVLRLSNGNFLVVWNDWRFTRPSLRYSVFAPDAAQPLISDEPFVSPEDVNAALPANLSQSPVFEHDGVVSLLAEAPDVAFRQKTLSVISRPLAGLLDKSGSRVEIDLDRLKVRINELGKAFVERRFEDAYTFFDPYYRARVSLREFMETQGRIDFKSYEFVENGEPTGVAVTAKTRIVAAVPAFKSAAGGSFEAEEKEVESLGRWLWIDGEWYREFYSQALEKRFSQY